MDLRAAIVVSAGAIGAVLGIGAHAQPVTPLMDLAGGGTYLGLEGGLYPGGANDPDAAQAARAQQALALVRPRDATGAESSDGLIGMVSIGMSNCAQEFSPFERSADRSVDRDARIVLVNGALGGVSAELMANPAHSFWTSLDARLAAAGVSPAQVQVVWLKSSLSGSSTSAFPAHALELKDRITDALAILHARFPNLVVCYCSTRTYGGYAGMGGHGEPFCFETAFAIKWLIEDQQNGAPGLRWEQGEAPVILWGPYLWANGATPRSDGLVWLDTPGASDFEADHVHPSALGEAKVAGLLAQFFATSPWAHPWWKAKAGWRLQVVDIADDATVDPAAPAGNFGADSSLEVRNPGVAAFLRIPAAPDIGTVLKAKLNLRTSIDGGSARLMGVSDTAWTEGAITSATAPPIDGAQIAQWPYAGLNITVAIDVTGVTASAGASPFSMALVGVTTSARAFWSSESADPPFVVRTIRTCTADLTGDGRTNTADFVVLASHFGASTGVGAWEGDLTGDGAVNASDFNVLAFDFGCAP